MLTVPAHPALWSYFDEASHHCRRYRPAELQAKLVAEGYQVEYLTQYMVCILPLVWLGRRLKGAARRRQDDTTGSSQSLALDELRVTPIVNELLGWLLAWEAPVIGGGRRLPFGASLLAVARPRPVPGG